MRKGSVAVLGAGSWGTALAILLAGRGVQVKLREWQKPIAPEMEEVRENKYFLPGFTFPPSLHVFYEIETALEETHTAVLAVPSRILPGYLELIPHAYIKDRDWVIATKGLAEDSGERMSEVVARRLPGAKTAVLAGPSLAREVAAGQPTTVLAASEDSACAERVRELFHGPTFRVYSSDDPIGVEIGTSLKNVVALAAGIIDGMGLGANAKGALITRGLAEITRLGVALGAKRETFLGLAGVGDLVTTCSSGLSRNRTLGESIGRRIPLDEALASMEQVAEGVPTTRSAVGLSRRVGVEMPITEQIYRVLFEGLDPEEALSSLMARPPRPEGGDE